MGTSVSPCSGDSLVVEFINGETRLHHAGANDTAAALGKPVQLDPVRPTLKPPGIERFKLAYDTLLSNAAFQIKLRRYSWES
jgi:hypothetical protein